MQFRLADIAPIVGIGIGLAGSTVLGYQGTPITFFSLFSVIACGFIVGPRLYASGSAWRATFWGSFSAIALLMLLRGAWFYTGGSLNGWANTWTLLALLVITGVYVIITPAPLVMSRVNKQPRKHALILIGELIAAVLSILGFLAIAHAAISNATTQTIRTPWPLMPWWTLPLIGCLWALALVSAWRFKQTSLVYLQITCALGAVTVIAPLLYVIGYGFDGFLHVAGERVLAETGTLFPKPPYYMGQYVLVTWISALVDLPVALIDRWLVPIAAAILIPLAAIATTRVTPAQRAPLSIFALALLPIGAFVVTTPHGFATVLGIIALVAAMAAGRAPQESTPSIKPIVAMLLAAWCTLTHPLVGIPILCAVSASTCWSRGWTKWLLGIPLAFLAGPSVPLIFGAASSLGSAAAVHFSLNGFLNADNWSSLLRHFIPWVPNRYALWPQTAEWVALLAPWIMCVFAALGVIHAIRHKRRYPSPPWSIWIIAAGSTLCSAIVLQLAGDFNFLIDYERGNYATRLFMVAGLLLLPVAIPEVERRLTNAAHAPVLNRIAVLLLMGLVGGGVSYAALPRHDAVIPSRGWSVSSADNEVVHLIDQDAQGAPYTVLANQSVSAAAVNILGFKRYNNDVFFYPIPTGGPLYDVFLRASYEDPSRETMSEAGRLGGSSLVYFVVNDYWWDAQTLMDAATSSTDRVFDIQQGKVKVFKYDLK